MPTYFLSNLEPADSAGNDDVLLLRSGGQDYRLPVSVLANDLLSDAAGAGKVGIQTVGGMYADNVQDAIEELYDREIISPQPLATTNSPTFAGLSLTGLTSATPKMIVAGSGGAISAVAHPDNVFPRTIYMQLEDAEVTETLAPRVVIPKPYSDSVGNVTIPPSHWDVGACLEVQFEFRAVNTSYDPAELIFGISPALFDAGDFVFSLQNGASLEYGRAKLFLVYNGGTTASATMHGWMEIGGGDPASSVLPAAQTGVLIASGVDLTIPQSLEMFAQLGVDTAAVGITIKNARVIWHPAPTGLA